MAESQPDKSEKTEQPSPYKLQEAKQKGSVAKSTEINHALVILTGVVLLWAIAHQQFIKLLAVCQQVLVHAGHLSFDERSLFHFGTDILLQLVMIISPLALVVLVVGVLGTLLQTGPIMTFHPIKPDFKRLNPVEGFKRLFSIRLLFETVKSLIKLAVLTTIVYLTIKSMMPSLVGLEQKSPQTAIPFFIGQSAQLVFRLVIALVVVALIDLLFTRWNFRRDMRMTRKEVKDEIKRREGDPTIRAKRRELERELRKRAGSAASVPDADVLITNPDHYAIVLKYDRLTMLAPTLTGKGVDAMAMHLKELARRYSVPVVQDPPLARELYRTTKIGQAVPEETFIAVARAIRQAYSMRRRMGMMDQVLRGAR